MMRQLSSLTLFVMTWLATAKENKNFLKEIIPDCLCFCSLKILLRLHSSWQSSPTIFDFVGCLDIWCTLWALSSSTWAKGLWELSHMSNFHLTRLRWWPVLHETMSVLVAFQTCSLNKTDSLLKKKMKRIAFLEKWLTVLFQFIR